MDLKQFLSTIPDASNEEALAQANSLETIQGNLIDATTINGILTDFGLVSIVKDTADNKEHIARDICLGVYTGLLGDHPFNFIQNSLTGQRAIAQLDWLISTGLPEHAMKLNQFKDLVLWRANSAHKPFASVTLHDIMLVRDNCPIKPLVEDNGWVTISIPEDVPSHNPRLLAKNSRTGNWSRVNSFYGVSKSGSYDAQVPKEWLSSELAVDNAYGVI